MSKRHGDYVEMTPEERAELQELDRVLLPAALERTASLIGKAEFAEADREVSRLLRRRRELLGE